MCEFLTQTQYEDQHNCVGNRRTGQKFLAHSSRNFLAAFLSNNTLCRHPDMDRKDCDPHGTGINNF